MDIEELFYDTDDDDSVISIKICNNFNNKTNIVNQNFDKEEINESQSNDEDTIFNEKDFLEHLSNCSSDLEYQENENNSEEDDDSKDENNFNNINFSLFAKEFLKNQFYSNNIISDNLIPVNLKWKISL